MDKFSTRAVAKISSSWVYAFSRRGIAQQGSTFGSIFLLFSMKVARVHAHSSQGKSPTPGSFVTALMSTVLYLKLRRSVLRSRGIYSYLNWG